MLVMRVAKGKTPELLLGKKVRMATATNSLGWEVQELREVGWTKVSDIVQNKGIAELMMEEYSKKQPRVEYRVYESLLFPVNIPVPKRIDD